MLAFADMSECVAETSVRGIPVSRAHDTAGLLFHGFLVLSESLFK